MSNLKVNSLTAKQSSFVSLYGDPQSETYNNGVQSMIRAGYAAKTAENNISQVMGHNGVKAGIAAFRAEIEHRTIYTRQQRQQFWTDMMQDTKANSGDRLRASELLGRSEADFTDNINDSREGLTIQVHADKGPKLSKEA